jgi:signal transduction histidine kinase
MRVQQVLINLLSNAIKFSHIGMFVFITVLTFKMSDTELEY